MNTVIPILLPGFLLMSIAPTLSWQSNKIRKSKIYVITFLSLSFIVLIQSYFTIFNTWGFLGILLGTWVILASLLSIIFSVKFSLNFHYLKNINAFIGHIGVGILIIGITCSSVFKKESDFTIGINDQIQLGKIIIKLEDIIITENSNFQSLRGKFLLKSKEKKLDVIEAGKNYYYVSKIITSEVGIYHHWFNDIYIVFRDVENNKWNIKIYQNPMINFIWLGVLIMIFSGIIGIIKK